jgi:hypothetical protein
MRETEAIIERVKQINSEVQHLELAVDPALMAIKPGQTLLARTHDTWDPYLREHWWPVDIGENKIVVERPIGIHYEPGKIVNLLGLVGQPYRFRKNPRNILLIAYDTPPTPLMMTIPWLVSNNVSVTLALSGTASNYATEHLPPQVEVIEGDEDINWQDQVMTVGWADQVFVVVPPDEEMKHFHAVMQRFQELRADIPRNYIFGVFRPILPCGTGACQACNLKMDKGTPLVCLDGPAFDLTQVVLE